jgi:hypothetical protein
MGKTQKLVEGRKAHGSVIASIPADKRVEVMPWRKLQQLPEN